MTDSPNRCPVHWSEGLGGEWSCPDFCEHFLAELERRVHDVEANGNFFRMSQDDDGSRWLQKFRNHEPVGERTAWMRPQKEQQ